MAIPDGIELSPGSTDDSVGRNKDNRANWNGRDAIIKRFNEYLVGWDLESTGLRP
jgi:hypothetical protein